jgi:hypothetical protein
MSGNERNLQIGFDQQRPAIAGTLLGEAQ